MEVATTPVCVPRAPHARRRSDELLRELFMQASDGIFTVDLDGCLTDVNRAGCSLLGCTHDELVGTGVVELIPAADLPRWREFRASLLDGESQAGAWTLRRKDGSTVPVEMNARLLGDGRWVGFVRDATARQPAGEQAEAAREELELRVAQCTEQLLRLGADLEAAEERERRKIARDLHDDLGQTLAAARIRLAALCKHESAAVRAVADEVGALIDAANQATRSLAAQLAPAMLYELGLGPALQWLGQEIERTFALKVRVADDGRPKPLSQEVRSILYRAARELLINVAKHARTDSAVVELAREGDRVVLRVSDAGAGFDPDLVSVSPQRGLGLVSLRERLSFIGGTADVRSRPGGGTVAVLTARLADREPEGATVDGGAGPAEASPGRARRPSRTTGRGGGSRTALASRDAAQRLQGPIDALAGHVALLDGHGRIVRVNRAWRELARRDGALCPRGCGPGADYLDVCRRAARVDPQVLRVLHGLSEVLEGRRGAFMSPYPCDSATEQRWFLMHAAQIPGGLCLVTHLHLTCWPDPAEAAPQTQPSPPSRAPAPSSHSR